MATRHPSSRRGRAEHRREWRGAVEAGLPATGRQHRQKSRLGREINNLFKRLGFSPVNHPTRGTTEVF